MMKLDINSMNGNCLNYAYNLDITKENSKSLYAVGMYGDEYRIEKNSTKVFKNGKQIADTCEFQRWS